MDTQSWFDATLALPGVRLAPMAPRMLIASSSLSGDPPGDPADRIVVATARAESVTLVTRDARILACGTDGYGRALAC